ncbi:hypothetical protein [Planobispora longispora]|uniref:Uncharacterized protein n=1 Tax=Planobispora longispora TaxID=28887 RepID=A0A8J3RHJ1_9ACTN|nr:hypothetical protein [Planobispora longispora]BFE77520.1 hypothetical protein GCM10020093_001210 [Planobispora longispora]GIH73962.1 hypothetical protein Plo01_03910 [Planobispora longispora]
MIRKLEELGDRLLGLALPKISASAAEYCYWGSCGCQSVRKWRAYTCCLNGRCNTQCKYYHDCG